MRTGGPVTSIHPASASEEAGASWTYSAYDLCVEPLEALIGAVQANEPVDVAHAIDRGADPDATSGSQTTPKAVITMAAEAGAAEVVQVLLDAGAAIAPDVSSDWVPLRAAIHHGHSDVVRLLLERGANPNTSHGRDSMLEEAIDTATSRPSSASAHVLDDLLRFGAKVRDPASPAIVRAVATGAPTGVLRILLRHGASPDQTRLDGVPLLVLATRRRDAAAVDLLLNAGADPNAVDGQRRTALMHAAELGFDRILSNLLLAGADPERVDVDGSTARTLAKGWQRTRTQSTLGEKSPRPEPADIHRTFIELVPLAYELRGATEHFIRWSRLVDHTLEDLGDEEFQTRLGYNADDARLLAAKLRDEPHLATHQALPNHPGAWHELTMTSAEIALVQSCLLNLAYGPSKSLPQGLNRTDAADLFEDLAIQIKQ